MSNSTAGIIDTIAQSQAGKETTANAYFDATSPATLFGRRAALCSGLTWGFYGGTIIVDGVLTQISLTSSNTQLLVANKTYYMQATREGVVSFVEGSFTAGQIPLYKIVTGASTVTSYTDYRAWAMPAFVTQKASVAVTSADVTLTAEQARARYLTITGVLTANRSVIVPNDWEGIVFCNNTGEFTTTIKTSAGTGIVVAQTKRAIMLADGTNVVRVTEDA